MNTGYDQYLFMATKKGLVKKTPILDYANVRKTGLAAISLRDDDELIEVKFADSSKDIILVTKYGQCIRFDVNDVRRYRKSVHGCARHQFGKRRRSNRYAAEYAGGLPSDRFLKMEWENGRRSGEFTSQNRGGKGVKCYKSQRRQEMW